MEVPLGPASGGSPLPGTRSWLGTANSVPFRHQTAPKPLNNTALGAGYAASEVIEIKTKKKKGMPVCDIHGRYSATLMRRWNWKLSAAWTQGKERTALLTIQKNRVSCIYQCLLGSFCIVFVGFFYPFFFPILPCFPFQFGCCLGQRQRSVSVSLGTMQPTSGFSTPQNITTPFTDVRSEPEMTFCPPTTDPGHTTPPSPTWPPPTPNHTPTSPSTPQPTKSASSPSPTPQNPHPPPPTPQPTPSPSPTPPSPPLHHPQPPPLSPPSPTSGACPPRPSPP